MSAFLIATKFAHDELGLSISEEASEIIHDLASAVVAKQTQSLQSEIDLLKDKIEALEKNQIKTCLICMENCAEYMWSSCMFFSSRPVAHVSVCQKCCLRISDGPYIERRCPICRATDGHWVRVDARA